MGMAPYMERLREAGLDEYQLYNAQGNSFDRTAVAIRIREVVAAWVRGGEVARHEFPAPPAIAASYERLRAGLLRAGLPACRGPFPEDLVGALLYGARGAGDVPARADQAAEDGRAAS